MDETCPLASIRASIRTSPAMCWVLASDGYAGGTEEIKRAVTTAPPTGKETSGATGCFALPSSNAPLNGDSPGGSCSPLASSVGAASLSLLRVLRLPRPTLGFARRTLPRLGLLLSASKVSSDAFGVLLASGAADLGMRSEMAAGSSFGAEVDEELARPSQKRSTSAWLR